MFVHFLPHSEVTAAAWLGVLGVLTIFGADLLIFLAAWTLAQNFTGSCFLHLGLWSLLCPCAESPPVSASTPSSSSCWAASSLFAVPRPCFWPLGLLKLSSKDIVGHCGTLWDIVGHCGTGRGQHSFAEALGALLVMDSKGLGTAPGGAAAREVKEG